MTYLTAQHQIAKISASSPGVILGFVVAIAGLNSCAQPKSEESPVRAPKAAAVETPVPSGQPTPDATVACWDKLLKTPQAVACTGIYTQSAKTCVTANLTKEATCTRESIAAKYGSATLNGQPVMTTVDQWIGEGYEANQCGIGSDSKLYVYFLKKVFTGKGTSPDGVDHYSIADKRLGPGGAILSSITLQTSTAPAEFSCN